MFVLLAHPVPREGPSPANTIGWSSLHDLTPSRCRPFRLVPAGARVPSVAAPPASSFACLTGRDWEGDDASACTIAYGGECSRLLLATSGGVWGCAGVRTVHPASCRTAGRDETQVLSGLAKTVQAGPRGSKPALGRCATSSPRGTGRPTSYAPADSKYRARRRERHPSFSASMRQATARRGVQRTLSRASTSALCIRWPMASSRSTPTARNEDRSSLTSRPT